MANSNIFDNLLTKAKKLATETANSAANPYTTNRAAVQKTTTPTTTAAKTSTSGTSNGKTSTSQTSTSTSFLDKINNWMTKYLTTQGVESLPDTSTYKKISQAADKAANGTTISLNTSNVGGVNAADTYKTIKLASNAVANAAEKFEESQIQKTNEAFENGTATPLQKATKWVFNAAEQGEQIVGNTVKEKQQEMLDTDFSKYVDSDSVMQKVKDDSTYASKLVNDDGSLIDYSSQISSIQNEISKTADPYTRKTLEAQIETLEAYQYDQNILKYKSYYDQLIDEGATEEQLNEFKNYVVSQDDTQIERLLGTVGSSLESWAGSFLSFADAIYAKTSRILGYDYDVSDPNSIGNVLQDNAAQMLQNAETNAGGVEKTIQEIYGGIAPFLYYLAVACVTGGTSLADMMADPKLAAQMVDRALLLSDVSVFGQNMKEKMETGKYNFNEVFLNSTYHAVLNHASETIFGNNVENAMNVATGKLFQDLTDNFLLYSAITLGKSFGGEAAEEGFEAIMSPIIDDMSLNTGLTLDQYLDKNFLQDLGYQMWIGGLSGLAMGTLSIPSAVITSKTDYNNISMIRDDLQELYDSDNAYSVEEKVYLQNLINGYNKMLAKYVSDNPYTNAFVSSEEKATINLNAENAKAASLDASKVDLVEKLTPIVELQQQMHSKENQLSEVVQNKLNEEGLNISEPEYSKLTAQQKIDVSLTAKYAQKLGRNVTFANVVDKNGDIVDGVYVNGTTIINPNAKLGALSTLIHEYTHGTESSKFYGQLTKSVKKFFGKGYDEAIQTIKSNYSTLTELTDEGAERELVAITTQSLLDNYEFVNDLVKYNNNLAYKLYTDITNLVGFTGKAASIEQNFKRAFNSIEAENTSADVDFSYIKNDDIMADQVRWFENVGGKSQWLNEFGKRFVTKEDLKVAQEAMTSIANRLQEELKEKPYLLPPENTAILGKKEGKVLLKDSSYGLSVENSTKCPRTLAYDELTNMVSEDVGKPLTAVQSFLVSQKLYQIAIDPQCLYCYVALDRKSYNEFVGRYIEQRDAAIDRYKEAGEPELVNYKTGEEAAENDPLFAEFLKDEDGKMRKATDNMWNRYKSWITNYKNGVTPLTKQDVATDQKRVDIENEGGERWDQLNDILAYAQSASWAKKSYEYRAYYDEIRKLSKRVIDNLNQHYGLRWYSFNDYTPAYILENMQQFTDASLKGLKGLAYTKDTDFARIFAPTGCNINISVFARQNADGSFEIDPVQSANLEEAKELRNKYSNVGIVVTATSEAGVRWALQQDWSDVVIPFHIVRTGAHIAEYYKWTVFNSEQNDTVIDKATWDKYVNDLTKADPKAKASKMIYPSEHQNDLQTYLDLCEARGLKPRFSSFLNEGENYMKLVNETRQSDSNTSYLKPSFDLNAANDSLDKFVAKGGFYGGWYKDGVNLQKEANDVANDIMAIEQRTKKYEDIKYGEGYVDFDEYLQMKANRNKIAKLHGKGNVKASLGMTLNDLTQDSEGKALTDGQKRYFANTKAVDQNGNLLRFYHGTSADFTEFDPSKIGSNGAFEGTGFNFTPSETRAKGYTDIKNGGKVMEGYLNITNPLSATEKTLTVGELANILKKVDPTGDAILSNFYTEDTRDYGTQAFINRASLSVARDMLDYADSDLDIYSNLSAGAGGSVDLMNAFKDMGYDGVIHYNDNGSIKTAVIFDSNQFKNIDNDIPTTNPDIRYSRGVTLDSLGKELSDGQKEYFKDSYAVDDNGNLEVVYHGTNSDEEFTVFDENENGKGIRSTDHGHYFTSNSEAADMYGSSEYKVYLNITNPLTIDCQGENFETMSYKPAYDKNGNEVQLPQASDGGLMTDEVTQFAYDNGYDGVIFKGLADEYYGFGEPDLESYAENNGIEIDDVNDLTDEQKQEAFQEYYDAFKGNVYWVKDSNQIKNVDNENPTVNPDIRYSRGIKIDTDGKWLTPNQQYYFRNSKAVDEDGNLKRFYHGTRNREITTFDPQFSDDKSSIFFTDNRYIAATYSGTKDALTPDFLLKYNPPTIENVDDANQYLKDLGYQIGENMGDDFNGNSFRIEKQDDGYHIYEADVYDGVLDETTDHDITENIAMENITPMQSPSDMVQEIFSWMMIPQSANYEVYLNLENPLVIDAEGRNWNRIQDYVKSEKNIKYNGLKTFDDVKKFLDDLGVSDKYKITEETKNIYGEDKKFISIDSKEPRYRKSKGIKWEETPYVLEEVYDDSHYKTDDRYDGESDYLYNLLDRLEKNGIISEDDAAGFNLVADTTDLDLEGNNVANTRSWSKYAKENGYDGLIFKNIIDMGGNGNYSGNPVSTVAIAFDSNQVKSVNNENPTSDSDIRYSFGNADLANKIKEYNNKGEFDYGNALDIVTEAVEEGKPLVLDNPEKMVFIGLFPNNIYNGKLDNNDNVIDSKYRVSTFFKDSRGEDYSMGGSINDAATLLDYAMSAADSYASNEWWNYKSKDGSSSRSEWKFVDPETSEIMYSKGMTLDEIKKDNEFTEKAQEVVDKVNAAAGTYWNEGGEFTIDDINDILSQTNWGKKAWNKENAINQRKLETIEKTKKIMIDEAPNWIKGYDTIRAEYPMFSNDTFNTAMYESLIYGELTDTTKQAMENALYANMDMAYDYSNPNANVHKLMGVDQGIKEEIDNFVKESVNTFENEAKYKAGDYDKGSLKKSMKTNKAYESQDIEGFYQKAKEGTALDKLAASIKKDLQAYWQPVVDMLYQSDLVSRETKGKRTDKKVSNWKTIDQNIFEVANGNKTLYDTLKKQIRYELLDTAAASKVEIKNDAQKNVIDKVKELGIKEGTKEDIALQYYMEGHTEKKRTDIKIDGDTTKETIEAYRANPYEKYTLADLKKEFDQDASNGKKVWENIVEAAKIMRDGYDQTYQAIVASQTAANGDIEGKAESEIAEKMAELSKAKLAMDNVLAEIKKDGSKESTQAAFEICKRKYNKVLKEYNTLIDKNSSNDLTRRNLTPYRENYVHHIIKNNLKDDISSIIHAENNVPTELAGTSDFTNPNTAWSTFSMAQEGGRYTPTALGSYAAYMDEAANVLAYNPVILSIRQLNKDIKSAVNGNELSRFSEYLNDYANMLAGKRDSLDRGVQKYLGPQAMKLITKLNSYAKAAALTGNIRSGLTQFADIPNGMAILENNGGKGYASDMAKGMVDWIKTWSKDSKSAIDQSSFMTNRYFGFDTGKSGFGQTVKNVTDWMLTVGDKISAETIWWSAYEQGVRMQEQTKVDPIQYADDVTRSAIAGRTKEDMALAMQSQTINLLMPFQVENNNLFQTLKQQGANKHLGAIATYNVAAFIFNMIIKGLIGNDDEVLPDVITPFYKEIKKTVNGEQDADAAAENIALGEVAEFISLMPYGSAATQMMLGDESDTVFGDYDPNRYGSTNIGLSAIGNAIKDMKKHDGDATQQLLDVFENLFEGYAKGGKQIMRTVEGLQSMGGLPDYKNGEVTIDPVNYTSTGENIAYVNDQSNILDWIRAALFGKSNTSEAQNYYNNNYSKMSDSARRVFETLQSDGGDTYSNYQLAKEYQNSNKKSTSTTTNNKKTETASVEDTEETPTLREQLIAEGKYGSYKDTVRDAYDDYLKEWYKEEHSADDEPKSFTQFANTYGITSDDLKQDTYGTFYDTYDVGEDVQKEFSQALEIENSTNALGKTIANSAATQRRVIYEQLGIYDDILEFIDDNGLEYSDFGLSKTVVGYDQTKIDKMLAKINGETYTESSSSSGSGSSGSSSTTTAAKARKKQLTAMRKYMSALNSSSNSNNIFNNVNMTTVSDAKSNVEKILNSLK